MARRTVVRFDGHDNGTFVPAQAVGFAVCRPQITEIMAERVGFEHLSVTYLLKIMVCLGIQQINFRHWL